MTNGPVNVIIRVSHKSNSLDNANGVLHVEPFGIYKRKSFHIVNPYNKVDVLINHRIYVACEAYAPHVEFLTITQRALTSVW